MRSHVLLVTFHCRILNSTVFCVVFRSVLFPMLNMSFWNLHILTPQFITPIRYDDIDRYLINFLGVTFNLLVYLFFRWNHVVVPTFRAAGGRLAAQGGVQVVFSTQGLCVFVVSGKCCVLANYMENVFGRSNWIRLKINSLIIIFKPFFGIK